MLYIYLVLNLIIISVDIGKFIQLIRIHKSIWNISDTLYNNRIQRTTYISPIHNEMNVTGLFS